jgi:outer membrane protein assembly factor BamB
MGNASKGFSLLLVAVLAISSIAIFFPKVTAEPSSIANSDNSSNSDFQTLWKTNVTWDLSETPARNLSETDISGKSREWTPPTVVDGVVYVVSTSSVGISKYPHSSVGWIDVYAFNAATGAEIWRLYVGSSDYMTNVAVGDGGVYFSAGVSDSHGTSLGDFVSGNHVYALNAANGKLLWKTDFGGSSPIFAQSKVFINNGYSITALDAHNGHTIWNYTTGGSVFASATVVNDIVYVSSLDGNVYALNANTGNKIWNTPTGNAIYDKVAIEKNTVFVPSSDGYFYALNALTGEKLWSYYIQPRDDIWKTTALPPSVSNGIVYFVYPFLPHNNNHGPAGNGWTWLYALNAANGIKIWNSTIGTWGSGGRSVPVVVDEIVYLKTDRSLLGLDANSGSIILNSTDIDFGDSSEPVFINGVFYIGSDDQIYAISVSSTYIPSTTPTFIVPILSIAVPVAILAVVVSLLLYRRHRKPIKVS